VGADLIAGELPYLAKDLDPKRQSYGEQPKLPGLMEAYLGTSPQDLADALQIGRINLPGTEQAVKALLAADKAGKIGATYCWANQGWGIPKCGAGSNFTSWDLMKIGATVIQGGRFDGERLLSAEYVQQIMDRKKGDGYFYYFHNRA
jgi:hypothetical protein